MDTVFKAIAADNLKLVLAAYFAGNPIPFDAYEAYIPGDCPSSVASLKTVYAITDRSSPRITSKKETIDIGVEVKEIGDRLVSEVERRTGRGQRFLGFESDLSSPNLVRAVFSGGGPVPVPPNMKAEMAEMARAGVTVADISVEYGYPASDVARILKSVKVRPAPPPPLPPPPPPEERVPDLGVTDREELEVAETLLSGGDAIEAAEVADVTLEQVDAVKSAWSHTSPTDAVSSAHWRRWRRERDEPELDPTTEGEILIFKSAPGDYRVEVAPQLASKLKSDLDDLRSQMIKGKSTTEHDVVFTNLARFANRTLPKSDKRLKTFAYRRTTLHEFKGFQARVFAGTMRSVYPGGIEVWRCGLLHCVVKKDDKHKNVDLDLAVEALALWRRWREIQDAKITRGMK